MTNTIAPVVAASVMASIVSEATVAAKGKVENYSVEVTDKLLAAYAEGSTVEQLAVLFGKTARSIVAKLSREKVYVKKEYVTKAGAKPVSKEEMVAVIAKSILVTPDKLESLEKANKGVLLIIETALQKSGNAFDGEDTAIEKASKASLISIIIEAIGSNDVDMASLKYANMVTLNILAKSLIGSAAEFDSVTE